MLRASAVAACRSSLTLVEVCPKAIRSPARPGGDHDQLALQVGLAHDRLVAVGEHVRRGPELAAARDDRELAGGGRVPQRLGHDRVGGLVDRDQPALLLGQDVMLGGTRDDTVDRLLERRLVDLPAAVADAQQRRLVDHVRELRAAEAGRLRARPPRARHRAPAGACRRAGAGSPGARARRACRSRPGGRSAPGAAARGRGCPGGWWRPSRPAPRRRRTRPSRRGSGSASARARRCPGRCRRHACAPRRRARR